MRLTMVLEKPAEYRHRNKRRIGTSRDIAHACPIGELDREAFFVLFLDQKHNLIGIEMISLGSLTASLVHPREVFRPAIRAGAAAIAFVHNHPSGDPTPSMEDISLTRRLKQAGELIGIWVIDHVIVGDQRYSSFADDGLLSA